MAGRGSWLAPDVAAWRDAELAGGDDALAAFQPLGDANQVALALSDRDRPQLRRGILLDDVDERSLRRGLRRAGGNEHRVPSRTEQQPYLHEAARPEMPGRVRHRRPQLHGAGAVLNGVVEEGERSAARAIGLVG